MPIPDLTAQGILPPGEHEATLDEVEKAFGSSSDRRKWLMELLFQAAKNLAEAGVPRIWIDGSFVTDKEEPEDIDGCWEVVPEIEWRKLDPVWAGTRADIKKKYQLDFFQAHRIERGSGEPFPVFFQTDREDNPRGIIVIDLAKSKETET